MAPKDDFSTSVKAPENCMDCHHHKVIPDPDPTDWFCDDDIAVVCTKTVNPSWSPDAKWVADRQPYRTSACSCRPYRARKEATRPDWCPLLAMTSANA